MNGGHANRALRKQATDPSGAPVARHVAQQTSQQWGGSEGTAAFPAQRGRTRTIAVVADQPLTGQAVGEALRSRGFATLVVPVPRRGASVRDLRELLAHHHIGLALLLNERPDWAHGLEAIRVIRDIADVNWLWLSDHEGDAWGGAALEAGAVAVGSMSMTLEDLVIMVGRLGVGVTSLDERRRLESSWAQRRQVTDRLSRLTARERDVLEMLGHGSTVAEIAVASFVAVGTVRSQVSAVLAKLEVSSQLAAVALVQRAKAEAEACAAEPVAHA